MAAEVGLAAFSSIVSEGAKSLFKPIIRQISYVFKYQSYIDGLKDQVKQLGYRRETVQQPVNHARLQGDEIYEGVTDWLNQVDEFSEGVAKSIIDDEDRAKKSCFKGLCPNLISRYKLSKQAAKAAEVAASLMGKGNFSNVSYRPAPKRAEHMQVKDYEAFDSRMKVFQDVVEALKDDKLNIIGVYGMGGVGKTTLVKQVAKQVMEDKLFDKVAMAEVTENPDHQKIQDKLASDVGIKFELNENIFDRANRLRRVLKNDERHLIILDNIWGELEFDKVGIPSGNVEKERMDDQRRCTIMLTSRSRDLLHNVMNSQREIQIDALSKKEALQLFKKIMGHSMKTSDFQTIADEIVEKCGGLPVALITVAKALKNERLDTWEDVLRQLKSSDAKEIDGMEGNVYLSIKLSYDFLRSEEAKSLFLLCGLISEGHAIPVSSLLRYGMAMGYFKNVYTLEEARRRVHALIGKLKSSCLLLDSDAENEVKMHDIIHAVAVSITAEKRMFNIPNVADLEKKMEETIRKDPSAISLPYRGIEVLPERLQCPRLELFLLHTKGDGPMEVSDHFFKGTEELRVLDFSGILFSSLPSSFDRLISLQTLCLDGCRLKDIAIVGQLKNLEILSLARSDIEWLPLEIGQLTRLQLLDLTNCSGLKVIAPNVISKLSRLEELYMRNSFSQWDKVEGGSNARLVELKGLKKLTTLEIHVPDAEVLMQGFVSVELLRYRIFIGERWDLWNDKSETSRLMKLRGLEKVSILLENDGTKMLLKRIEDLRLVKLKGIPSVVHELDDQEGFTRLKHLHVEDCFEILHIVGSVKRDRCEVFPLLETLYLICLDNLETICYSQLGEDQSFSNLRTIKVQFCGKLKHLFSFSTAKNLLRLQKVEVEHCHELKMIIGPDIEKPTTTQGTEIIAEDDPAHKVTFPRLEELELSYLRNIEKLWPNQFQGMYCCQNLTKVTMTSCDRLKYLFSYSMVNSLLQLQHLEIRFCDSMEGVVNNTAGGLGGRDELKVFPKLHTLRLEGLPKLCGFVSAEDVIHTEMQPQPQPLFDEKVTFPRLKKLQLGNLTNIEKLWPNQFQGMYCCQDLTKVTVWSCGRLKYLFSYSMVNSLGQLQHLDIGSCRSMEVVVNTTGLGERDELKVFPKLHYLSLHWLPELRSFASPKDVIHTEMQPQPLFDEKVTFPRLEKLQLGNLTNIEKLWPNQFQGMYCCQDLTKVTVRGCGRLKYLFSYSMVNSLGQLQHLEIGRYWSMEGVVNNTAGGLGGRDDLKVFPKLHYLSLHWLPELRNFASPKDVIHTEMQPQPLFDEKVRLPSLEVLHISRMDKLRKIWHHQLASESFGKLKELEIKMCENLMNIFPPLVGIRSSLVNLNVSECEKIEEIIGCVGEEVKENRIAFSELKLLVLDDLPRLTSFCLESYTLEFPSLERVSMTRCPSMKTFSQGILSTPKLREVQLTKKREDELRHWEGNLLNSTIQKCYEEMVGFRGLQNLKLSYFPHLRELWHGPALPVGFFNDLERLVVDDCKNMSSAIPANLLRYLNNLHYLEVRNCDSVEEVFHLEELNSAEEHFGPLFPKLWVLKIMDLPKLKRLCNFTENIIELPGLWHLTIENCPDMETFVSNSASVLHVTTDNKEPQKLTSEENFLLADQMKPLFDEKVAFLQLMELKLSGLHKVQHLWKENAESNRAFATLERQEISECSKLQKLVPPSWHLEKLTTLKVSKCHGLINVLTFLTSKSLVNLERMEIADCKMTKEIIQSQVGEEAKDCIVLRKLKYLGLDCLPSLTSFCLGNYALEFPSLEQVVVRQCPTMKIFSQGVVDTPKLNKVKLTKEYDDDDEGCWEGNLNDTIQKLFNEMNSKDKIEPTLQVQ